MTTTEVAVFPLKAGSNPGDPDSEAGKIVKATFDTLNTIDGMRQIQFGMQVENPTVLQMMVNWDSKQHHDTFAASDIYQPFLSRFMTICDGDPTIFCHCDFKPEGSLSKVLSAPVTEAVTVFFDDGPTDSYVQGVQKFMSMVDGEKPDGYLASAYGVTYEELEKDGAKGKAVILTIGWQSIDHHMKYRETESFKNNVGLLRGEAKGISMAHVAFMQYLQG